MLRRHFAAFALAAVSTVATAATPTVDQWLSLRSVQQPRISPDGRFVVYEEQRTEWSKNGYVTQLLLADASSGRTLPLTSGKETSAGAQWSPDGRWIAFLSTREASAAPAEGKDGMSDGSKPGGRQIWLISPGGGEAWTLTAHGAAVSSFRWSPDGKRIAFSSTELESRKNQDRREKYGDYQVYEADYEQNQLWIVDVAAAETDRRPQHARQLTSDATHGVDAFDWSPDGKMIAFTATRDSNFGESDIYVLDVAAKTARPVVTLPSLDRNPRFSPDGTRLAFDTTLGQPHLYANTHIAVVELSKVATRPATKVSEVRDLTAAFDEDAKIIDWTEKGIYFRALQRTASHLFRIEPESGAIARVSGPAPAMLNEISISHDGRAVAYTAPDATHLSEVYTSAADSFAPRKLTDSSAQIAGWTLGSIELVQWKSRDGTEVEGVLHKPADFDVSKRYPLLVVIHGGPNGVSRPELGFSRYPIEQFLAKGALVLEPNYRGSAGYGSKFRALNVRNLGVGDSWDVLSGVDALERRGIADESKLGAMGWSHGGFVAAFLTTNTTRFEAISVGAGTTDWTTFYAGTDFTPAATQYLGATPWKDPQIYAKASPITNIRNAKTPTLIQHGDRDHLVPMANAYALYRGLRDQGVPTTFIIYPGFGHGIGRPKSLRAALQQNYDWFGHYIWGEEIPKDSPLRGSSE
jgi:dipeptidyl aminopeptidase/acylaminoacyl peptidase